MFHHRLPTHIIAAFLLLSFAQGVTLRLWVHEWVHKTSGSTTHTATTELRSACNCVQDAQMPLQPASTPSLTLIRPTIAIIFRFSQPAVAPANAVFYSLKGPPASVQLNA